MSQTGKDTDPVYVLAAGIVIPILCTGFIVLRFQTRYAQKARLGADDWLTIPALLLVIGCGVCLITGVALRVMGFPTPPLDDPTNPAFSSNYNIQVISKLEWAILIMQPLSLGFVKLSFVFFYRRIFVVKQNQREVFDIVTVIIIVLLVAWSISYLFAEIFVCKGHWAALWTNLETLTTQCIKTPKELLSLAVTDFLTDLLVLCLPIRKVLQLHMSIRRKLAVLVVFALGLVAMAMSIMRLYIFVWATEVSFTNLDVDNNLLVTRVLYWSTLEAGLALVACCLPTTNSSLKVVFDTASKHIRKSTSIFSLISHKSQTYPERPSDDYSHHQQDMQLENQAFTMVSKDLQTNDASPSRVILVTKSLEQIEQMA